ncbi:MAG: hypothetical protein EBS89_10330 [Proteobacteria bacterium]|nr:hypothetical protein [Pseudomonadota bacterium]
MVRTVAGGVEVDLTARDTGAFGDALRSWGSPAAIAPRVPSSRLARRRLRRASGHVACSHPAILPPSLTHDRH